MADPNWAEQVTAIATALGAVGLLSAIAAAAYAGRQVRESEQSRHAQLAAEFLSRWNSAELVETRRLVARYESGEHLRDAFLAFIERNDVEAYVLYRELDYFEQLGAMEELAAINIDIIRLLLGDRLMDRWEMWKPSIDAMGYETYPRFEALARKVGRSSGGDRALQLSNARADACRAS